MKKPKRMFVMMEVETAIKAAELRELVQNADIALGVTVLQVHVNVAKAEKKPVAEPAEG